MTDKAEHVGQEGQTIQAVEGVLPIALVDGSNVAHSSEGDEARLQNIKLVVKKLISEGYEPVVVADAALRHQIDDKEGYERRVEEGKIKQAPAGTDADYFLLAFARELDAVIVSNDLFRDRAEAFPEARERMIRYMIVDDQVVFERRNKKR
jgi:Zc3h12a-like Ribonuclease NYN domain